MTKDHKKLLIGIIEVHPPTTWSVSVVCYCGNVNTVPTSPNPPPFKIGCWNCDKVLDVDTTGMKPEGTKYE